MNGERGRRARGGWRPAKHIFAPHPWRRPTASASSFQGAGQTSIFAAVATAMTKTCDGLVTVTDGKCDGFNFLNHLISNICDGVTAQNPGGFGATTDSKGIRNEP